ncbi:MAG: lamin tail domain-containing protein, partial [Acidobacteriota bacterium]
MAKPSFWLIHALGVGFLILVLGGNNTTSGQETGVVITEVMWDGLEYVELYNPGSSDVSLEGWQLVRSHDSQEEQDVIVVFSATDVVSTQSYFLLEKKEEATARAGDALAPSLVLHNDGNILRLLNSSGQVIDDVGRIGPWLAGQNTEAGVSMERIAPHSDGKEATSWRTATAILFGRVGS